MSAFPASCIARASWLTAVVVGLHLAGRTASATCLDYGQYSGVIGGFRDPDVQAVARDGGTIVTASYRPDGAWLHVWDGTDLRHVASVDSLLLSSAFVYSLALGDGFAYVGGSFGLQVVQLSPLTARGTSSVHAASIRHMVLVGHELFASGVSNGVGYLMKFDVGDPDAPVERGWRTPGTALMSLAFASGRLLVGSNGLLVVSPSDTLQTLHTVPMATPSVIAADGGYAYADAGGILTQVDVRPGLEHVVQTLESTTHPYQQVYSVVAGEGQLIAAVRPIASGNAYQLIRLDVTNPAAPAWIAVKPTLTFPAQLDQGMLLERGLLGVAIRDVSHPEPPEHVGATAAPYANVVFDLAASDGHAYLTSPQGFGCVDIGDPSVPAVRDSAPGWHERVEIAGDFAFTSGERVRKYDIVTDPGQPILAGQSTPAIPAWSGDFALSGPLMFAAGAPGLDLYDVSGPPLLLGHLMSARTDCVACEGSLLCTWTADGAAPNWSLTFRTYDLSIPSAPALLAELDVPMLRQNAAEDIVLVGQRAVLAHTYGFLVVDCSDPSHPLITGDVCDGTTTTYRRLRAAGSTVYMGTSFGVGVIRLDGAGMQDLRIPSFGAGWESIRACTSVAVDGDVLVTGGLLTGDETPLTIRTFPVPCDPAVPVPESGKIAPVAGLSLPRPNPARRDVSLDLTLGRPGPVEARVFDVAGREVRALAGSRNWPAGTTTLGWDMRSARGLPIAPGTYFLRVSLPGRVETRKVVVVR